jgi:hypothetical protein
VPIKTMDKQELTSNSCAAHCLVIAVAEFLKTDQDKTKNHAELIVWPKIQFQRGESLESDGMADSQFSDPRKVVEYVKTHTAGKADAKLCCDELATLEALKHLDSATQASLSGLFNMMKGNDATVVTNVEQGHYYNCSFLNFSGGTPDPNAYQGMHNILVTNEGGFIWYYDPLEAVWVYTGTGQHWRTTHSQIDGGRCYFFTGVCVETKCV